MQAPGVAPDFSERLRGWLQTRLMRLWFADEPSSFSQRLALVALLPLSVLVGRIARSRRARQRQRNCPPCPPVVVVGNLVVGGTGKTPVTIALAKALGERGLKVGVVCSAYRARDGAAHMVCAGSNAAHVGDEAVLLARATGVPVAAGRSRAAALSLLLARAGKLDVVLSDDGLQHLGLARTVEIGVFDERGLGNGRVLPAGPLREPATVASELDALLLNGTDRLPCVHPRHWRFEIEPGGFHQLASGQTLTAASFVAAHRTAGRILAMAGIARPERFFSILRAFGLEVTGQALTDHARIHPSWLASADADLILLTDKDAVKWPDCADPRCWSLSVQARLPAPFIDWLLERLNGPATA